MVLNDTGIITVCQNYVQDIGRFLYRPHVLSVTNNDNNNNNDRLTAFDPGQPG